jgi:raffinose/stachyose/melibiose transport system permease protein
VKHRSHPRRHLPSLTRYLVLGLLTVFALGPLVIMAFNSLKSPADFGRNPLGLPQVPVWDNYPNAWESGNFATTLRNSSLLVAGTVAGELLLSGLAAYGLARLKLPGANLITVYLLVVSSLPTQLFLVPLFYLWRILGLVNSLLGVILIYIALNAPFAIFLLRSYIVQIPADFDDAARVDGASEFQVFAQIVLPLTWPAFLTVGLVVALSVWNEFLIATVFLTRPELSTVITSYYNFSTRFSRDWGLTSAAAMMMTVPIVVIFLLLQRRFIEGLTQGGLKT